jgi:hypothetical protein
MTTHHREGYLIHTHYDPKPIPIRGYDWTATLDGYDGAPDSCDGFDNYYGPQTPLTTVGCGRTEEGAIQELLMLIRSEEEL